MTHEEALDAALNQFLGGDEVTTTCPECGEVLLTAQQRNKVLVACPNACIGDERKLRSDPGGSTRLVWIAAALVILGLGLLRACYLGG